jgi:hypothetical protein
LTLALVRDMRELRERSSVEEIEAFETDVLAGLVLARASAGLADSTIRMSLAFVAGPAGDVPGAHQRLGDARADGRRHRGHAAGRPRSAARARGQRLGRPPAMTAEQIRQARDLLTLPRSSISSIARLLGVSRSTIYKHLLELAGGRREAAGQIPPPGPGLPARLAITAPQAVRPDAGSGDNAASGRAAV